MAPMDVAERRQECDVFSTAAVWSATAAAVVRYSRGRWPRPFDCDKAPGTLRAMTPALQTRVRWAWRSERGGSLRAA